MDIPGALTEEYEQVTLDGLGFAAAGLVTLAGFVLAADLLSPPHLLSVPVIVADGLLIAFGLIIVWLAARRRLPARLAPPVAVVLSLLAFANILLERSGPTALKGSFAALVLISFGCVVFEWMWLVGGLFLVLFGWLFATGGTPGPRLLESGLPLLAAIAVCVALNLARRRSIGRAALLRRQDAERRAELERALAQAAELREALDQQVAARTEELTRTAEELRRQLAEHDQVSEERAALLWRINHEAMHDALTGLPNRGLFFHRLEHAWLRTNREPEFHFAVLYVDLDRFKVINDTFGHTCGDQLLVEAGRRLQECLRATDLVARLGGDEFAMLIEGYSSVSEALAIARRAAGVLREPFHIDGQEIYCSGSIGIADGVVAGQTPEQYVRDADVAMYAAKSRGSLFERFDGAMHTPALVRMQTETELRSAIDRQQFFLVYQPIVDMRTMRLEGFEALVRWRHPARGVVPPDEFIGIAEETRLIGALTRLVLRESCRQAALWRQRYDREGGLLGINLSAQVLTQEGIADEILGIVEESGLSPSNLVVEVTESGVMASPHVAGEMLAALRSRGVQVFIDDFGTGYSSLAYLTSLPFDRIKIDKSFVRTMHEPDRSRVIRTIATLAHDLNKQLVAEGVETPAQLERLRALGVEYGQGWIFSRPMDAAQAEALLEADAQSCAFPGLVEEDEAAVEAARLALVATE